MFWKDYKGWPLKGTETVEQQCSNCGNTGEHFVYVMPKGLQFGFVFLKKPLVGKRQYFLACPTCGFMSKELSKKQAQAMKGSA